MLLDMHIPGKSLFKVKPHTLTFGMLFSEGHSLKGTTPHSYCAGLIRIMYVKTDRVSLTHHHAYTNHRFNSCEMNTNEAYGTNTAEIATKGNVAYVTTDIATKGNVAYMTAGDTIPATQNVAYGQVPPAWN